MEMCGINYYKFENETKIWNYKLLENNNLNFIRSIITIHQRILDFI